MADTNTKSTPETPSVLPQESNRDRWAEIYRYEGASRIFLRAVRKIFRSVIQVDRLIVGLRDLTVARAGTRARVPLEIRLLRIEEAEVFAATFHQPTERIRRRLVEGDQCILGIVGNRMVHFEWFLVSSKLHRIPIAQTGLALVIQPGDVYSYSAFTLRNWRGNAIAAEVSAFKHGYLKTLGCTRKFHYRRADNISSARGFGAKNGRSGTTSRTVWVISLFRSRWRWIFGAASDASFSFVYSANPADPAEFVDRNERVEGSTGSVLMEQPD